MVRTAVVLSLVLASATAAAVAALRVPRKSPPAPVDPPAAVREGALRLSARLDRRWIDARGGTSYLEVGVAADGVPERGTRTAVNAVLIIDRSGSMSGEKIARARDAARSLIAELNGEDLLAALAAQGGGRTRFIHAASELEPAVRAELTRSARTVARDVRLEVRGLRGTRVVRVLGYDADGGSIRLPDFAAGEERRVLVKLALAPSAEGDADVARVALSFADAAGVAHQSETAARGSFTGRAALLGLRANEALAYGARAELAELARDAAELKGEGRAIEAAERLDEMQVLLRKAAVAAPPASMPALQKEAHEYQIELDGLRAAGDVASKRVKQQAFDSLQAPISGW